LGRKTGRDHLNNM